MTLQFGKTYGECQHPVRDASFGRKKHATLSPASRRDATLGKKIMAHTFTKIHIHVVFAVQNRESLIQKSWQEQLYKYIITIIQKHGHKVLAIGGMSDHIHILFGFRPTQALSNLMQEVKRDSSEWINRQRLSLGRFSWQEGYSAFSYSQSHVMQVVKYIETQEEHHKRKSFIDEYKNVLNKFDVEFDERYIFKPVEK